MTAQPSHAQFRLLGIDTPTQAAAMWRGAMIDRFSRLETSALACLRAVDATKIAKASCVAWHRFSDLRVAIEGDTFAPANKKAILLLDAIAKEHELRIGLAHGVMSASRSGLRLDWQMLANDKLEAKSKSQSWIEALESLNRVDKLARDFASQCGQVRRLKAATRPA